MREGRASGPRKPAKECRYPPPPVFWEKRLQTIENKGNECRKECKETTKRRQADANKRVDWSERLKACRRERWRVVHPLGFCMDVKINGLREEGFVRV